MIQMLQEGRGFNALRMELKNQKITAEGILLSDNSTPLFFLNLYSSTTTSQCAASVDAQ